MLFTVIYFGTAAWCFLNAILLSRRITKPGTWTGYTPGGQIFIGIAITFLGIASLVIRDAPYLLFMFFYIAFLIVGGERERKARKSLGK